MSSRATMSDIARLAGVSASTVSRALNNHPTIPQETRDTILKIARELNYRMDERARNFRLRRSGTVATLFPYQGESRRRISDPFYLEIFGAITDALDEQGYSSIIARVPSEADDWPPRFILDKRVDGIILIDRAVNDRGIEALLDLDARFVIWGAQLDNQSYVSVGCDGAAGAAEAVRHLAKLGRRHIGFIGGFSGMVETDARREGYLRGLHEAQLPVDDSLMHFTDFTPEAATQATENLLHHMPNLDGLFVCSDFMAVAAMDALHHAGRAVPLDVSVVGYDDIPLAAYCSPRLTTIHQPIHEGGRLMVQKLLEMMDGRLPAAELLPHQLIVRDSCGGR